MSPRCEGRRSRGCGRRERLSGERHMRWQGWPGAAGSGASRWGEVGLPGLVRLVGFEADVAGLGALLGLGHDQPEPREVAGDGGDRDSALMVVAGARRWCRVRRRVLARRAVCGAGRSARPRRRGSRWGGLRATGAGLERGLALGFVAALELVHPGPGARRTWRPPRSGLVLDEQGSENETGLRHRRASPTSPVSPIT
jgi:hypothetical protein